MKSEKFTRYKVAYSFDAEEETELPVVEGQIVVSLGKEVEDGWILVRTTGDQGEKQGFVPFSFLEEIADEADGDAKTDEAAHDAEPKENDHVEEARVESKATGESGATVVETLHQTVESELPDRKETDALDGNISPAPNAVQEDQPAVHAEEVPNSSTPTREAEIEPGKRLLSEALNSNSVEKQMRQSSQVRRLTEVQMKLQEMREQESNNALMSRFIAKNSVTPPPRMGARVDINVEQHMDPANREAMTRMVTKEEASRLRFKNKIIFRRNLILLGYQEVGKTSLRKCFESEPFFFKSLPEVRATTGVEVQQQNVSVEGDKMEMLISDFAGQEMYHSHTYFLTKRTIFALVWKISAVEQDFHSTGINSQEEERLYKWVTEVYAKFPRAHVVIIATHLDELRVQGQRSVELILSKVEGKIRSFLDKINFGSHQSKNNDRIIGSFAVSCKTRQVVASGDKLRHLSGEKISALLDYLTKVAREDCMFDREYPSAAIPGRHAKLIENIMTLKAKLPTKLIMPIGELVHMAASVGIESDAELLQVTQLMHSWDIIYILHPYQIEDNAFIMLHPRWLCRMAASLFSYAHIQRTPRHMRSFIGGLEYTVSQAEHADMYLARRGYIRWPLARVLFRNCLSDFLKRKPDDSDVSMCLELLQSMQVIYPVQVECDEYSIIEEETPVNPEVGRPVVTESTITRFFVPSLAPYNTPEVLKRIMPIIFHGGIHYLLHFNLLPDELWWRLQCELHTFIKLISVHQPVNTMVSEDMQEEEELLTDGFRLKEADDEHNRWKDSMWLMGEQCRLFVCRHGRSGISIHVAEAVRGASDAALVVFNRALANLLLEYEGVKHSVQIGCPTIHCEGGLDEKTLLTKPEVSCRSCGKEFQSQDVRERTLPSQFPENLLKETGDLLACCLSQPSCVFLCDFLSIPYCGPAASSNKTNNDPAKKEKANYEEAHAEYLHALDKVVQAALFQSWMKRLEDLEKRKRMLEVDPSPLLY